MRKVFSLWSQIYGHIFFEYTGPFDEEKTLLPLALDRIKNLAGGGEHSEYHVGTWVMTILMHMFNDLATVTPEQRNDPSSRYLNIVVENKQDADNL